MFIFTFLRNLFRRKRTTIYTVKTGDTLSKIALDHLGAARRYPEIFNLNRDILDDPDMIKPGQALKIPQR